jgi:hypothetical protein
VKRLLLLGPLVLAGALAVSASALAALSLTIGTAPSFSVTLTGADQAPSYSVDLTVSNTGGTKNSGWNLTITSTEFATGGGATFPTTASTITGVAVGTCSGVQCSQPVNSITYPLSVPAGSTPPAAVKVFNAAVNSGSGTVTVTPTVSVAVPGNSFAGTYTSTLTVSAVSGP